MIEQLDSSTEMKMESSIEPSRMIAVDAIKLRRNKPVMPIKPSNLELCGHSVRIIVNCPNENAYLGKNVARNVANEAQPMIHI